MQGQGCLGPPELSLPQELPPPTQLPWEETGLTGGGWEGVPEDLQACPWPEAQLATRHFPHLELCSTHPLGPCVEAASLTLSFRSSSSREGGVGEEVGPAQAQDIVTVCAGGKVDRD